jgi:hypothetical protein
LGDILLCIIQTGNRSKHMSPIGAENLLPPHLELLSIGINQIGWSGAVILGGSFCPTTI